MKLVSKLALAAVLTLGSSALGTAPALAQKADKKADNQQIKVSEAFRKPAAAADTAIKAKDYATAETQVVAAEAAAKNDDEQYYAALLRLQLELGRKNEAGQMKALAVLSSNPKTPADKVKVYGGIYNYMLGNQLVAQKKPAEAIPALLKSRELGYDNPDTPIMLANAYVATGKDAEAVAEVERAIATSKAAGRQPPADWFRFAIPRVNKLGDRAAMASWLTRYIQAYPTVQNWRWAIQVFRQGTPAGGDPKVEKMSLYRLMRATGALADRADYADYAYAAQQAGLPWEAVSAIDEGRKNGKVPAGDADTQRIYAAAQNGVRTEGSLEPLAKQAQASNTGKLAAQTADAFLASGNYARAIELYDAALKKGGVNVDEVNLNRGVALRAAGRKPEAEAAFEQVKTGPFANLALLWQTSVNFPPLS